VFVCLPKEEEGGVVLFLAAPALFQQMRRTNRAIHVLEDHADLTRNLTKINNNKKNKIIINNNQSTSQSIPLQSSNQPNQSTNQSTNQSNYP
jgi:hypothetical protein